METFAEVKADVACNSEWSRQPEAGKGLSVRAFHLKPDKDPYCRRLNDQMKSQESYWYQANGDARPRVCLSILLLLLLCLGSRSALALDPQKAITQYIFDSWTSEDGLPQNTVVAIAQTRDGYLWLGTEEGLTRFDGVSFTVFDLSNTPEINNNIILALYADKEDSLWIGTYGGMSRFKDGNFTSFTTRDGLTNNIVRGFCEDKNGTLWIATDGGGLNAFKDGKFISYTTKDGLSGNKVLTVYEDREGNLWIGTYEGAGLCKFKDGKFTTFTKKDGLTDLTVWTIHEDRQGTLWVGAGTGLHKFRDGKFTSFYVRDGLKSVYEDTEGNLWIGTFGGGLNRFKDGKFSSFTTRDGLSNQIVRTIYEDKEGSLWIGTDGGGLNRLRDGKFTSFTSKEALSNDLVWPIYEDRAGSLWIGTFGGGLNRLKDGKFTSFTTKEGLSSDFVISIYEDSKGSLWIGTLGGGLNRLRNGKFTSFTRKEGLSNAYVFSITEDKQGSLWIGTSNGELNRFRDGKFTSFIVNEDLSNVLTVYSDRQGSLWVGTTSGLGKFWNGRFTSVITEYGSPNNVVRAIYEDKEGNLWTVGSGGLNRFKDGKLTSFDLKTGLAFAILEDDNNNLWITSHKGVFRVSKDQLNDFADGRTDSINPEAYSTADGLKSNECNPGSPAGFRTRDGKLWFATIKGVSTIDPTNVKLNTLPPPVAIEKVSIDGKSFSRRERVEVPPGAGDLEFQFTGLSFVAPKKVRFKYKLEGFDKDWVDAGTARTAHYTNIPPGNYRFHVIACNNDGFWNETGAAFEFYLRPRFYQRYWFYTAVALGFLLLGLTLHRQRVRTLKNRKKHLQSLVDERTKDLLEATRELQDISRRQADFVSGVSHGLKTPLTLIRLYGETLLHGNGFSKKVRRGYYRIITRESERLANLIDNVLDFSRIDRGLKQYSLQEGDIASVVDETVAIYEQQLAQAGFTVHLNLASDLPPVQFDPTALSEVILNLLDNASKYSADQKQIWVSLRLDSSAVILEVEDHGVGITDSEHEKIFEQFYRGPNSTDKGGYGLGLFLVKNVMDAHGGTVEVQSEAGQGCLFRLSFPLNTSGLER